MTIVLLLALFAPAFAEEVDELGGFDGEGYEGEALKLIEFVAEDAARITEVEFAVGNDRTRSDVWIVLYVSTGQDFELVDAVAAEDLPDDGEADYATSGEVSWDLDADVTYAIGAWVGEDWVYYWSEDTEDPWFGYVRGSLRVSDREVPDDFEAPESEGYFYAMRVTSEEIEEEEDTDVPDDSGETDTDDGAHDDADTDDGSGLDADDPIAITHDGCGCNGGAGAGTASVLLAAAALTRRARRRRPG